MIIKIGTDIIRKKRFINSIKNGGDSFINRLFTPQEIRQNTQEQLASIFCLKEAIIKALELKPGSWGKISTNRTKEGKVECSFVDSAIAAKLESFDTSISHEEDFIISVAAVIIKT